MEEVLYEFPDYSEEIIRKLLKADWFIHSFDLDNEVDIYNPAGYLYNAEFNNLQYTIHLDLNVYQYVLSAFKKSNKNILHRDAIALIIFGKFTNIIFDPTLAVYEKLNYLEQCPDELVDDLLLFRQIDNSSMDGLAEFSLGYTDNIRLPEVAPMDRDRLKSGLTEYRRLKKWDTFYLFILKVTELYHFDESTNEEKINKFLKWCFSDFLYSLVAISFVIKLLGKRELPKLMKYKGHLSVKKRKDALINMAWDLFLLDKFFEKWVGKEKNKEFIYASNDRPLKEVLEMAISIQLEGNANQLGGQLSSFLIKEINIVSGIMGKVEDRKIVNVTDFKYYRDGLINKIELIVLS